MLEAKLTKGLVEENYLQQGLQIPEVKKKMQAYPVSHENVLAWALKGSTGPVADLLNARLEGATRDLTYLEHHYPPALDLMPEKYREITKSSLERYLEPMIEAYWPTVTTHLMSPWLNSESAKTAKQAFDEFIHRQGEAV